MKTKYWMLLLGSMLLGCLALSFFLLAPGKSADTAKVYSGGKLIRSVNLGKNQTFIVETESGGRNEITVRDGHIAVTQANCPDHYCMHRGFCSGGADIVCLPNRLVISFSADREMDAILN